jgi:transcriptional regulator with XRE-family HTH domain
VNSFPSVTPAVFEQVRETVPHQARNATERCLIEQAHERNLTQVSICAIIVVMKVNSKPKPRGQSFGDMIRAIRRAKNLGLVDVAKASGMDPGLLSRIETGKRYPPEIPGLIRLAKALGVPEDSDRFGELLAAADRARNPALHDMALAMRGGKLWNPFSADLMNEEPPVFCESLAELVSKATARAITTHAEEITVKSASGAIQKFRLLWDAKRKTKKRTRDGR